MSTIHPELISVIHIKVFKAIIDTSEGYLNIPEKPEGIDVNLGQNTALNIQKKNIRLRLNIVLQAKKSEGDNLGLRGEFGIEFHIHVDDLERFLVDKDGEKLIDSKLGATIIGIIYSTARGIVYERTRGTLMEGFLLPVINPNILLGNK
tara:strand:+ start:2093 stop:2539 length:447 start_codon:yes stop_codon:yes gene_type:complete